MTSVHSNEIEMYGQTLKSHLFFLTQRQLLIRIPKASRIKKILR